MVPLSTMNPEKGVESYELLTSFLLWSRIPKRELKALITSSSAITALSTGIPKRELKALR